MAGVVHLAAVMGVLAAHAVPCPLAFGGDVVAGHVGQEVVVRRVVGGAGNDVLVARGNGSDSNRGRGVLAEAEPDAGEAVSSCRHPECKVACKVRGRFMPQHTVSRRYGESR